MVARFIADVYFQPLTMEARYLGEQCLKIRASMVFRLPVST